MSTTNIRIIQLPVQLAKVFAKVEDQANSFHLSPQSQWKAMNNTHVQWASLGFFTDCFVYFQTHSVYIFGGRHNIGHWTCCQISVWQRHWKANNGLGERYGPRFPGSTNTKQKAELKQCSDSVQDTRIRLVLCRETVQQQLFLSEWFHSHFLTFFPFTPYWLLSSLKEKRNRVVYHGRRKISWHKGQWEI